MIPNLSFECFGSKPLITMTSKKYSFHKIKTPFKVLQNENATIVAFKSEKSQLFVIHPKPQTFIRKQH